MSISPKHQKEERRFFELGYQDTRVILQVKCVREETRLTSLSWTLPMLLQKFCISDFSEIIHFNLRRQFDRLTKLYKIRRGQFS